MSGKQCIIKGVLYLNNCNYFISMFNGVVLKILNLFFSLTLTIQSNFHFFKRRIRAYNRIN